MVMTAEERGTGRRRDDEVLSNKTWGQDYKERDKLDSKQISNSPC